jgi:hypothetical protein
MGAFSNGLKNSVPMLYADKVASMLSGSFLKEYNKYRTTYGNDLEGVGWLLWHKQAYTSTVTVQLPYFTAMPANREFGNMEMASALPSPSAFLIRAVRIRIDGLPESTTVAATGNAQTGYVNDIVQLLEHGCAELTIGAKTYGQWPMWALPAGGGIVSMFSTGDVDVIVDYGNNGSPDPRAVFSLTKPLFIPPMMNFRVDLTWPNGPYTLVTGNLQISVLLDGDRIRPVQ